MNPELLGRQIYILERLSSLPRKILSLHGNENISELVLHELCRQECFNIDRAAYFIDNPDFDCLKGVVGHCRADFSPEGDGDVWQDPQGFGARTKESAFNKKVRGFTQESAFKRKKGEKETADLIAHELDLSCHGFYSWQMKHDNHGIFIYERAPDHDGADYDKFLPEGVMLLGFCPVF